MESATCCGMESTAGGMESRPKEKYSLRTDAMRGQAAIPYNAEGVDSMPSPSVLDKKELNRNFDLALFW